MRVVYYVAASLDGRIADADGGVAWLDPYGSEELGYHSFINTVGVVVLGRRTYSDILGFGKWPYDGIPGVVLSHSPLPPTDDDVEAYAGDLTELITRLKGQTSKDIWIVGGGDVAGQFLAKGLIDEVEIYRIPVVLGAGATLFGDQYAEQDLELISTTPFSNGVVKTLYKG